MVDETLFCCIRCEEMLSKEKAEIVFRTGFYRSIHALGCCRVCYEAYHRKTIVGMSDHEELFSEERLQPRDASSNTSKYGRNQLAIAL